MIKKMKNGVFTYNNESYNFDFKTYLSAYEKQVFVKTVVKNLVYEDGYDAIIKDLIFDFAIIELFTNVDTSFINMKDDDGNDIHPVIIIEHFLEETNIVDIVKANMESGLLDDLNRAVELNIQYLTGIQPNPLNEAIARLVSTIEDKVNKVDLDSAMDMINKFANMKEDFSVENIVNAYMNSDVHKENLEQIAESKKE
jgi:hypothetical protein